MFLVLGAGPSHQCQEHQRGKDNSVPREGVADEHTHRPVRDADQQMDPDCGDGGPTSGAGLKET